MSTDEHGTTTLLDVSGEASAPHLTDPEIDEVRTAVAMHARIAAANSALICERGRPALIYWPGVLVFVGVSLAPALLMLRTLQAHAVLPAVLVGVFLAMFVWQGVAFFGRNRPGGYNVAEPPRDLLPG